jgi:signal transduction histidine kinase
MGATRPVRDGSGDRARYDSLHGSSNGSDPEDQLNGHDAAVSLEENRAEKLKRRLLRLALDVHDGPMQNLTAVGHSLNELRRRIEALVPPEHQTNINAGVEQITTELVQVEQELRALINALEEGANKTVPLLDAIETEIHDFKRHSHAEVELTFDGTAQARTDSQRIALQAIARAALANIARHADAYNVKIRLHGKPSSIMLEIEDDGRGFDSEAPIRPGRLGLAGMKERAELLGGELNVSSRPGGPTIVSAVLQSWTPPPPS